MLKRLSQHERLQLLLGEYEPIIRAAFLEAIADIRSKITLRLLIERLERRDIGGAIEVLHIEREAFGSLETAVARAYEGGGIAMAEDLRLQDLEGHRVVFRFGVRNPEAEQWLRDHSAQMVTVLDANTFTVSATPGGTVINTSSTQSGVHTGTTEPVPSKRFFMGLVTAATEGFGGPNNVRQLQTTVEPNTNTVRVAPLG